MTVTGEWFHRGPCHACTSCGGTGCYVWNDDVDPEVHVCERGCDGFPPGLEAPPAARRSRLGDCCQNHDPMTAPVVYPHAVTAEGVSLRARYRCGCGTAWSCWWDMGYAGWTPQDVESFRKDAA